MFGWDDTKKIPRRDSRLIVIGDDRQTLLQRGAPTAFRNYGCDRHPLPKLEERAPGNPPRSFRAIYDHPGRLTASAGMSPWFCGFAI